MSRHLEFPRPLSWDHDYWLCRCEGFRVDAPTGSLGLVEAVRFGARLDRPDELLVRGASAATLGREAAKGAGSGPITVPALARRDGAWAKRP